MTPGDEVAYAQTFGVATKMPSGIRVVLSAAAARVGTALNQGPSP